MQRQLPQSSPYVLLLLVLTLALTMVQTASAREMSNHTSKMVQNTPDMGTADPSQVITVKLHLQGQNEDQISTFIQQLHDPSSPSFQKWITPDQFQSKFGATAGNIAAVQNFVTGKNLKVISSDSRSITVQGTIGDIQNAFHTQIHQFNVNGNVVRANTSNPIVDEPVGSMVRAISGLTQIMAKNHSVRLRDSNKLRAFGPNATATPDGLLGPANCLGGDITLPITIGAATATFTGNTYSGCTFQPSDVTTAYKFNQLHAQGLDGTGQTIVIVDAFGSPTLAADLAVFDALYGLPPVNLHIDGPINVTGVKLRPNSNTSSIIETTLDVEWAHVVAPGARIELVVGADNSFDNLNASVEFAIKNNLGPVISNSYGAPENAIDDGTFAATEEVIAEGAAAGISVNYSSGDDGDFDLAEQQEFGTPPGTTTVSYPSGSPFATSIGGTSLFVNDNGSLNFQTGWGNNIALLSGPTFPFPDGSPADGLGFVGGSGGGASQEFAKPHFQRSVNGNFRQQPDISYLADPQTGAEVVVTLNKQLNLTAVGGTSLACPMFSALWAIAAQAANKGNIGQAAQLLYDLKDDSITDIRQVSLPDNATEVATTANGTIHFSPADLSFPNAQTRRFVNIFAADGAGDLLNLTFGTDSSLFVDNGWDNVTGLGTPDAPAFVQRVVKQLRNGGGN
jgi:subtilase family serine protease